MNVQFDIWLKQSSRSLWQDKSFALTVVLTMAIASGVFLWVLTLGWQVLFKPLPYPASDQLQLLQYQRLDGTGKLQSSAVLHPAAEHLYAQIRDWQRLQNLKSPAAQSVVRPELPAISQALLHLTQDVVMSDPTQLRLSSAYTSPELQQILGMPLLLGHGFTEAQQPGGMNPGVILSYQAWQLLFQQRADVLGQTILINGVSHPVLGVLAKDFTPPQLRPALPAVDLYLPWDYNNAAFKDSWQLADEHSFLLVKGDPAALQQWLAALTPLAQQQFADNLAGTDNFADWRLTLQFQPLQQVVSRGTESILLLFLLGGTGLLLIATANILNLFLSRLMLLQKQLAVRAALGARRIQLGQQLFSESMLLMLSSIALALLLTHAGFYALNRWFDGFFPRSSELGISAFSVISALILAVLLALLIATLSLHTVRYHQLSLALQSSGKGAGVQIPSTFRRSFILLQFSCAIVLVYLSSLVVTDAWHKLQRPLGLTSENVLQVEFSVASLDWQGWNIYAPKVAELARQLRQQPTIAGVSFAFNPLVDRFQMAATDVSLGNSTSTERRFYPIHRNVDQHYFQVAGQALLAGRGFSAEDINKTHSPNMVVNRTFAMQLLAGETTPTTQPDTALLAQVLGKRIQLDIEQQPFTIVGVTEDIQLPGLATTPPRFYMTNLGTALWMLIKLEPGATFSKAQMIQSLKQAHSQFALTHFSLLSDQVAQLYLPKKLMLLGAITLALFTIVLSGIGLIGVMQYNLLLRRSEFSIKLALGAQFRRIVQESGSEYVRLLAGAVLLSSILLGIGWLWLQNQPLLLPGFDDSKMLNLTLYGLSLFGVILCGVVAHYLPLRRLKSTSIQSGLYGVTY